MEIRQRRPPVGAARHLVALAIAAAAAAPLIAGQQLVTGPNTNMAGGPAVIRIDPYFHRGDPLHRAQNEPSCTISSRNPQHVICGANNYALVDVPGVSDTSVVRDAWMGVFQSTDFGATWESTHHPGFFLDPTPHILKAENFHAAADPTMRGGPAGTAYLSGIAFSGPDRDAGAVFVSTFIDLNRRENDRMPFKLAHTVIVDRGGRGQFIDKPWSYVEATDATCTFNVGLENGTTIPQTVPGSTIHMMYSVFVGNQEQVIRTKLMYVKSTDCGQTFSRPVKVSESVAIGQGVSITKPAVTGSNRVIGVFRRFEHGAQGNALMAVVSNDNGATWTKASLVANLCPFEQATTTTSFRATMFPSMAADRNRAYVAYVDRGRDAAGACNPLGPGRIMVTNSVDGLQWTPAVQAVPSSTPEHQIWPALAFNAGKLFLAWLDFKEDASGTFGRFVNEAEVLVNDPKIRHTGDVRAAMSEPISSEHPLLEFDAEMVSRYARGVHAASDGKKVQLQWNAVNKRWARKGTVPFNGDYIDIATQAYLPPDPASGRTGWTPNNGLVPTTPQVLIAWTDNRDIGRVTGEGQFTTDPATGELIFAPTPYAIPNGLSLPPGSTSIFDPGQDRQVCTTGADAFKTRTMNQNTYAARATVGFLAGSPGNNKPLGTIQRAFVVFVRNDTSSPKSFRLSAVQPPGGIASFHQFDATKTALDPLNVPRFSSVARTVFVSPTSPGSLHPDAVVRVDVTELVGGAPAQSSPIFINSDPSAPEIDSPEIDSQEVYAPEIDSPEIDSHGFPAPEIDSPEIDSPEIDSAELLALGIQTPEIDSPEIDSPEIDSPEIDSPEIDSPEIDSSAVTDVTFGITNNGNTTAQYNAKAFVNGPAADDADYQVIVREKYPVPAVDVNCNASTVMLSKVLVNLLDVDVTGDATPDVEDPDTATFAVAPGQTVYFTLRVRGETDTFDPGTIQLAVQPEAVDTEDVANGETEPPIVEAIAISTAGLPEAVHGTPYEAALDAVGGTPPYFWSVTGGTGLPAGLTLDANTGEIGGTPAVAGTFDLEFTVTDSRESGPRSTSRMLTLAVRPSAASQEIGTLEDTPAEIVLSGGGGGPLAFQVVDGPGNGQLACQGASCTYVPNADFNGEDSFTYTASLLSLTSPPATVFISVAPVNDAPVAVDDAAATRAGVPIVLARSALLGNDTDIDTPADQLGVSAVSNAANGVVALNPDGTILFTPAAAFAGVAGFDYTISDGELTDVGHVAVTITARDVALIDCSIPNPSGGDLLSRGFYVPSYPGSSLRQVDLWFSGDIGGDYTFSLTARTGAYNGALIGAAQATVRLVSDRFLNTIATFDFGTLPVAPGSLVTFTIDQVSGPGVPFYAVVNENPCPIVQTEGTEAPLSQFRRNGIVTRIFGDGIPTEASEVLLSDGPGEIRINQSFNETRGVDVTVLTEGELTVTSMKLAGLNVINDVAVAVVGARIYDSNGNPIGSAATVTGPGAGQEVIVPITATLLPGTTYRVAFHVGTEPAGGASGNFLQPTGWTLEDTVPYTESTGTLRIERAWSVGADAFPTNPNVFVPQITLTVQ